MNQASRPVFSLKARRYFSTISLHFSWLAGAMPMATPGAIRFFRIVQVLRTRMSWIVTGGTVTRICARYFAEVASYKLRMTIQLRRRQAMR
jgi:hypothetical protein